MLEAEIQSKVLALNFNEKKSIRQIAHLVEEDRKTVRRIIDRKKVHLERQQTTRASLLEPYRDEIKKLILKDPTIAASTILHRIRDSGYMGLERDYFGFSLYF